MIQFRLQSLPNYSFGSDNGVAQVSHRDNGSYRFGLLFVWPRTSRSPTKHAAISRAAGIGGYVCAFQQEESLGRLLHPEDRRRQVVLHQGQVNGGPQLA
jgi:hypothetical protein